MWSSQVIWGCFSPSTNKYSISERKREASVWEKIKRWSSERDRDRIVVGPRLFLATWGGERQLVQTKDWMRVGRWTPVHWTGTRASSQAHLIPAPPTSFLLRPKLIGKKKKKKSRSDLSVNCDSLFTFFSLPCLSVCSVAVTSSTISVKHAII